MSFTERRLDLPSRHLALQLLDWGGPTSQPVVLLVHANGACAAIWDPIARILAQKFRVIAFDLRGHGRSDKPSPGTNSYQWTAFVDDLVAVAEAVGPIETCVGHSFSGSCAILAAEKAPGIFGRLLLIDPVLLPEDNVAAESIAQATIRKRPFLSRDDAVRRLRTSALYKDWRRDCLELFLDFALEVDDSGGLRPCLPVECEAEVYRNRLDGGVFVAAAAGLTIPIWLLWSQLRRGDRESPLAREFACQLTGHANRLLLTIPERGHFAPMEIAPGWSTCLEAISFFASMATFE